MAIEQFGIAVETDYSVLFIGSAVQCSAFILTNHTVGFSERSTLQSDAGVRRGARAHWSSWRQQRGSSLAHLLPEGIASSTRSLWSRYGPYQIAVRRDRQAVLRSSPSLSSITYVWYSLQHHVPSLSRGGQIEVCSWWLCRNLCRYCWIDLG